MVYVSQAERDADADLLIVGCRKAFLAKLAAPRIVRASIPIAIAIVICNHQETLLERNPKSRMALKSPSFPRY